MGKLGHISMRLELTPSERDQVRILAAQEGISMAEFSRQAVLAAIEAKEQEQKRRFAAHILKNRREGNEETREKKADRKQSNE
jgi:hypothetical protein